MELGKSLSIIMNNGEGVVVFRTLRVEDVSEFYISALRKERELIENASEDITIQWQKSYVSDILISSCDTICCLCKNSELIGTAGVQNLSKSRSGNRLMPMAIGGTYDCTLGVLVIDEKERGKGYGRTLVWSSCYLVNNCLGIKVFKASIKKSNLPSLKSFLSCGFLATDEGEVSLNVELEMGHLKKPEIIERVVVT